MKAGWTTERLGDLAEFKPPKREARKQLSGTAEVTFLPMEDLGVAVKYPVPTHVRRLDEVVGSYTYFADGDLLLAKITPCFENGKLGIARGLRNGIGFGSSEFLVIRPGPSLSGEWLFYFLSQDCFREEGASQMGGAVGQQRLPREFVEQSEIPLPPLSEQRRIVALLDEAFAGLATAAANAERNLDNARELFESHLAEVFSRRGDGWLETTLGSEIDLLSGFAFKSAGYTTSPGGVRLLRGDNIIQGSLRWEDEKRWPAHDVADYARFGLLSGDVVLAMDRPWVKAGLKRAQITQQDLPCLLVQRTARLRAGEMMTSRFLYFLVSSDSFVRHIVGGQTGSGVPHISGQQIRDFRFARPPLKVQEDIAAQLDSLSDETERLSRLYEQRQAALAALKRSLLHHAFSGNL